MNRKLTMDNVESARLCNCLEEHLDVIFTSKIIGKYLAINGDGPELQILDGYDTVQTYPNFKLAFTIWCKMNVLDRHNVIAKFHQLYKSLSVTDQGNRKMLVFCALFVHEFVVLLAQAMEWPD